MITTVVVNLFDDEVEVVLISSAARSAIQTASTRARPMDSRFTTLPGSARHNMGATEVFSQAAFDGHRP